MIVLKYAAITPQVQEIEERLRAVSIDYLVQINARLKKITMQDGKRTYVGEEEINRELKNLEEEANQWNYAS